MILIIIIIIVIVKKKVHRSTTIIITNPAICHATYPTIIPLLYNIHSEFVTLPWSEVFRGMINCCFPIEDILLLSPLKPPGNSKTRFTTVHGPLRTFKGNRLYLGNRDVQRFFNHRSVRFVCLKCLYVARELRRHNRE